MGEGDATLAVRLPAELLRHARSVAESRDETLSQVVRRALRSYVASGPQQLDLEDAIRRQQPAKPTKKAAKPTKPRRR
jgi:predicted transcriptional regulator